MARRIEGGKHYRLRRGQLVEIPKEWVGHATSSQRMNKRHSKTRAKQVYNKILRAQDKDAMRNGRDPHPENTKHPGRWHYSSGDVDKYRLKRVEHRPRCSPTDSQTRPAVTSRAIKGEIVTSFPRTHDAVIVNSSTGTSEDS